MSLFDVVDEMPARTPAKERNTEPQRKRLVGRRAYQGGFIRCSCGAVSPYSDDPLSPFRWLTRHGCS